MSAFSVKQFKHFIFDIAQSNFELCLAKMAQGAVSLETIVHFHVPALSPSPPTSVFQNILLDSAIHKNSLTVFN